MHELHAILDACRGLDGLNREAVLATVVHVTGSAYRRPGARMLIIPDGRRIGSVSGGCLEGEITQKAWWFTEAGEPVIRVYDTSSEDDAVWEFGLGCNGVVEVMLERVHTRGAAEMLRFLDVQRERRADSVVATVIRGRGLVGARLLCGEHGASRGQLAGSPAAAMLMPHVRSAFRNSKSSLAHEADLSVFVEFVGMPQSLVILGAGHDAIPLAAIASQLGWRVTVADGRPSYAAAERFPGAEVLVMQGGDPLREVPIDSQSAVVMMTHNFPLDAQLLPAVLAARPRYLGMLGPKARTARLFEESGLAMPAFVDAPAGLDIGCDTPAQVAVSIVAGIQAALAARQGGKLRDRQGAIHPPVEEAGSPALASSERVRPAYCETRIGSYV